MDGFYIGAKKFHVPFDTDLSSGERYCIRNENILGGYSFFSVNKFSACTFPIHSVSAAVVGAGTVVVFLWWWWWSKKQKEKPPSQWRKVGELSDLIVYPIKSLGSVRMNTMECTKLGLKSGWLRDRTLMVIDLNGHFVTGRQNPKMVQVIPKVSGTILTLSAPGMISLSIDLSRIQGKGFRVAVWGQPVFTRDCGEEAARWLSRFLLQEDTGFRLVYYPLDYPTREIRKSNKQWLLTTDDTGAYPDATSYCLINEASVTDLNTRLEKPVNPEQFRPNFVIKGASAYEEDTWGWVKIGDVIFKTVMPCTRCIFTTVDPETGTKNPKVEPLKTNYNDFLQLQTNNGSNYSSVGRRESSTGNSPWIEEF